MIWKRMRFQKKNKVWAKLTESEDLFLQDGKVLIKYQLDQPHQYWTYPDQLKNLDESETEIKTVDIEKIEDRKTLLSQKKEVIEITESNSYPENAIIILTDGASSGNPGPAGIGVVLSYGKKTKEISRYLGNATNNIAELTAILTALKSLKRTDLPVFIHTDSSYSIGVLTKGWKPKVNLDLISDILSEMTRFRQLQFIKVKGHAGNPLNERADQLATQSIETHLHA